jgi:outer membrane protein assembly factor BamB
MEQPSVFKAAANEDAAHTPDTPGASLFGTSAGAPPENVETYGTITAIDVNTGKQAYHIKTKDAMRGGLTSTDSGLTFFGELDGKINAMDTKTGKILWTFQTGGSTIQAAPAVFTVDGKEYVTFTTGGRDPKVFTFGLGGDKTQAGGGTGEGDGGNAHQG